MSIVRVDPRRESPERVQRRLAEYIEARLDNFAATRGYADAARCITYIGSAIPQWAAEAARMRTLRDQTWQAAIAIMAAVQASQRPIPTEAELDAELPVLSW